MAVHATFATYERSRQTTYACVQVSVINCDHYSESMGFLCSSSAMSRSGVQEDMRTISRRADLHNEMDCTVACRHVQHH